MRCTNNSRKKRMQARRRRKRILRSMILCLLVLCVIASFLIIKNLFAKETLVAEYEQQQYNQAVYKGSLFSSDLCVVSEDENLEDGTMSKDGDSEIPDSTTLTSAALLDVDGESVDYSYNVYEKLYPASVTKIMTALVALENGNLSDVVTVNVDESDFAADEQTCGLKRGDQLTLEALLNGLLLHSGNDNANAIAEYIGGSVEEFAKMMNKKAAELMATGTHFVNPSGLHDDDHYTTAYDIYLIFNECVKNEDFVDIIDKKDYKAEITGADGTKREVTWEASNYYAQGTVELPEHAKIIGGKTGTTKKAGNCLVLLNESQDGKPYISIVMGAKSKDLLYQDMTTLIQGIASTENQAESQIKIRSYVKGHLRYEDTPILMVTYPM